MRDGFIGRTILLPVALLLAWGGCPRPEVTQDEGSAPVDRSNSNTDPLTEPEPAPIEPAPPVEPPPEPEPPVEPPPAAPIEPPKPEQTEAEPEKQTERRADKGDICRVSERHLEQGGKRSDARPCKPGLQCCYPCGVAGCNWVCATKATCNSWRTLP